MKWSIIGEIFSVLENNKYYTGTVKAVLFPTSMLGKNCVFTNKSFFIGAHIRDC